MTTPFLPPPDITQAIEAGVAKWDVPRVLAYALSFWESGFNPMAESAVGARGLFQIICFGGGRCGYSCDELWDLYKNADCGCQYLRSCLDATDGSVWDAIAAYNEGIGAWQRGDRYAQAVAEANGVTNLIPAFEALLATTPPPEPVPIPRPVPGEHFSVGAMLPLIVGAGLLAGAVAVVVKWPISQ